VRQQSKENRLIQEQLRSKLKRGEWSTGAPLPPARELAKLHGVSSSTAYRILVRLTKDGLLWQHTNGRFYAAEARHLVDTVQPFACMLPRLQLWNVVLQEIMHGVTQRSAQYKRGILLIHNPALIVQDNINIPPTYADAAQQEHILGEFFATHADSCEGIIFDNVWKDEVLAKFRDKLKRMVVINRKTSLDFVSAVFPNFQRSALLAFAHLYGRGYETVYFVSPHDDHYIEQAMEMGLSTAQLIGADFDETNIRSPRTPEERRAFARELKQADRRIGVYCPDDNWAYRFYQDLQEAGLKCPEQVGLLSGIGTAAVRGEHPLSTLKVDFEHMGELAVDCLRADQPRSERVDVSLSQGLTT
jgi:DNA-binding LacI/PurR family transcriptional regulator